MSPAGLSGISLNGKFLDDQANASLDVTSPGIPSLALALLDPQGLFPPGEIVLGDIKASAKGAGNLGFGGGLSRGTVNFSGEAGAQFGVGVYSGAANAIKALDPAGTLLGELTLSPPEIGANESDASRYLLVRAGYNIKAAAKGSVGLGTGVSATFGVEASSHGLFAVLHRFREDERALQVLADTFGSVALPSQIRHAEDLAPGTWLIAEIDGSVKLQAGVQAGYDFSWLRELPNGALAGPIGLRVQLGASAALGFEASGKFALVLGREQDDQVLRLRLYKLAKKGWNFALDARAGVKAILPPFLDNKKNKAEDLVSAIFGLNENQLVEVLKETRKFVSSEASLSDKLAGVLMALGGSSLQKATGLSSDELRAAFETGRQKVVEFLEKLDELEKTGGHDLTSMLLSLGGQDLSRLQGVLTQISGSGDPAQVAATLAGLLGQAGFERTPAGRFIEAAVGPALGVVTNSETANKLRAVSDQALDLLSGQTLQQLLDFFRGKVHFNEILKIATETDFDKIDNLLKARIASFLGKETALLKDLEQVQSAIRGVLANADKFYSMAVAAAKTEQEFSFSYAYSRSTTRTALVDVAFDLSFAQNGDRLQRAIDGDFDDLLLNPVEGVTLRAAELTHNIRRNVATELTLPFGKTTDSVITVSDARLNVIEDDGRVLVYTLEASDTEAQRSSLFRARSGRNSTLTVGATLPLAVSGGVKVWKENTFSYHYKLEQAVQKMRASQLLHDAGPLITAYLPDAFTGNAGFPEWVADLDKALDGKDPNSGTLDIGDTLMSLTLSAPPSYLKAWMFASRDRLDFAYTSLSKRLQDKFRSLVSLYYFSDLARYKNLDTAAAVLVFSCLPLSTSVKLKNGQAMVEQFDTKMDLHWYSGTMPVIQAMANTRRTKDALLLRMRDVQQMLLGIPALKNLAKDYEPTPEAVQDVISSALKKTFQNDLVPQLLGGLLFLEAELVDNAARIGMEMASFQDEATTHPAEALQHLAEFGEKLANTFNQVFSGRTFMSGAAQALGTLMFMEAAAVLDEFNPSGARGSVAAMMRLTVIQSGKASIEDMLAGKIRDEIVLSEQTFVHA